MNIETNKTTTGYSAAKIGQGIFINSSQFMPLKSHPTNDFTFFMGDEGLKVLKESAGIEADDIRYLPSMVLHKCRELGFAHGEPVRFLLDAHDIENEYSNMTVCKIEPSISLGGESVTRSVFIFGRELRKDLAIIERDALSLAKIYENRMSKKEMKAFLELVPGTKKTKGFLILSHELVHIFATDEYKGMKELLGVDLLEMLTDSINFKVHIDRYRNAPSIIQGAFTEGFAYITNYIKNTQGVFDPNTHIKKMEDMSNEIIKHCKKMMAAV